MKIAYLLDRPELGGGVKVVYQHAALLAAAGHRVTVAARGPRPAWALPHGATGVEHVDYSQLAEGEAPRLPGTVDLAVATYWTTLAAARRLAATAAHLCQGYEADWPHQRHNAAAIEAAYRQARLPAWVVSPHLGELLRRRYGVPWRLTPPPLDRRFRRRWVDRLRSRPRRRPWIAVPGIFEAEIKGVTTALEAVRSLRARGLDPRLLRVSVRPPSAEEETLRRADLFLAAVGPRQVAAALRRCDLLLFAARPGEGFGLPLLEALASGVPSVASRLPSTELMVRGAVPLVPWDDPEAFAAAAADLLTAPWRWRQARRDGLAAAQHFRPAAVAEQLREAVTWAAAGAPDGEAE